MTVGLSVATMYGNVKIFVWLPWQPFKSRTLISWGLFVTTTQRNTELLVHNHNKIVTQTVSQYDCFTIRPCCAIYWSRWPRVLRRLTPLLLTMFPSSYHHEIFGSYYQWQKWRPCKRSRSKVKVTEVTTQLNRFRTVTPVWIHIWWWNGAYSLIMLRRGALLFFKVIRQISRSHGSKNCRIWPRLGVSGL